MENNKIINNGLTKLKIQFYYNNKKFGESLIKCPKCGADNEENSNFCLSCGERLKTMAQFCPECGNKNVENAKFCENCGTSMETSGSEIKISESQNKQSPNANTDLSTNSPEKTVSLNLTPAESLIILDHKEHQRSPKELLKSTLIDLIFKNVYQLNVQEVEKKGIFGRKMVKKIYLEEGKNFNMPLKPHEEVFRKHLPHKANSKRLRKLQQRVYRTYGNNYAKKKLLAPLASEGFFTVEKKILGNKYSLTEKGTKAQQMILELKNEGKNLDNWLETDPERAKAYLLIGGSNIFLTDDDSFNWFKNNFQKIRQLYASRSDKINAFLFFSFAWYGAFKMHPKHMKGIEFDQFDDGLDFDSFDSTDFSSDFDGFDDIFSDFDAFDVFDSLDAADFDSFDSGFDSGDAGYDGGFD
jgi:hypothetical protein